MTPERFQQISKVYNDALDLEPLEREAFLKQACAYDEELRLEVESLISAYKEADNFIDSPALNVAAELLAQDKRESILERQISHYQILSLLGVGGMGEVYLAQDTQLGRKVALKLLPSIFTQDHEKVRRFQREARAVSALNHPSIITIYEVGEINDLHFIATEYIKGETLRERLSRQPLSHGEVVDIIIQVAGALVAVHAENIVHRDIKPENIMLRPDGYVKVLDFGLAKLSDSQALTGIAAISKSSTQSGIVMGTIAYMSPEQARGMKVDSRTDIFSLGVMLYEMLSGRAPFLGETPSDVIAEILITEPPPLADYSNGIPNKFSNIVSKALCKDPDKRYQTAKEFLDDIKSIKRDLESVTDLETLPQSILPKDVSAQITLQKASQTNASITAQTQTSGKYALSVIKKHKRTTVLLVIFFLIAVSVFLYLFRNLHNNDVKTTSIAVLPFTNVGNNPNMEYLSDGISESLIFSLSQLPQLKVIARSSAFKYKGKDIDLRSVAEALGVEVLVTGKVEQHGDNLKVTVELVDANNMTQIWGKQYNRKATDLLWVQAEISREISVKLRPKLSSEEQKRFAKNHTTKNESYMLYLKGRYFWKKRTNEGYKQAMEFFQQAIDKDPNYTLAYVGLADSRAFFRVEGETPRESYMKAKVIVQQALKMDDSLGEAHATMGMLIQNSDWDWMGAEEQYQRAITLSPNYATAYHWYSELLIQMGRVDEGLAHYKRALEFDPLSLPINSDLGISYYYARQYDNAVEQLQKTIEIDPNFFRTYFYLARIYEYQGQYEKAVDYNKKGYLLFGENPDSIEKIAQELIKAFEVSGERGYWLKRLEIANKLPQLRKEWECDNIGIYARLSDKDRAFSLMENAYDDRVFDLLFLKVSPEFDMLRTDTRFQNLQRRIGLMP